MRHRQRQRDAAAVGRHVERGTVLGRRCPHPRLVEERHRSPVPPRRVRSVQVYRQLVRCARLLVCHASAFATYPSFEEGGARRPRINSRSERGIQ